jgi:hypothetical protein
MGKVAQIYAAGQLSERGVRASRAIAATWSVCVLAGAALLSPSSVGARPVALAARTISLSETAHLHLTSKHLFTLNEEGTVSGTIKGTIFIHLHVADSQGEVTAEVNIYPHGGSLSGSGSSSYRVEGAEAEFSGKLSITRGTGGYAGAHASSLRFTGSIQRRSDAVTVQLSGPLTV